MLPGDEMVFLLVDGMGIGSVLIILREPNSDRYFDEVLIESPFVGDAKLEL